VILRNLNKVMVEVGLRCWRWFSQGLSVMLAVSLLVALPLQAGEAGGDDPVANQLRMDDAVVRALQDNPDLAQMQARYQALREIPSQRGVLPDPVLSVNAMNLPTDTFHVGQEAMTQMQVGISQSFPFPGKLALREQISELAADAAGYGFEETRIRLVRDVKRSWWQLFYLDRALDIVQSNQALLRNLVQVVRTKYEVADGRQQDVLLAQLELSKLIDQQLDLKALRRGQAIQLNRLMAAPADSTLQLPLKINESLPELAPAERLLQLAEDQRPLLQQLESRVGSARSQLDLANKDYYPDFKLGLAYGERRGEAPGGVSRPDLLSVMMSVNLPIHTGRRQSSAVKQRTHELSQSRYQLEDELGRVRAEVLQAVTDYERARQQLTLFKGGIIPQAEQTVASMRAGYQVDEVDFLNLVRSQITLFNYQLRYWQMLTEANQALAQLVAAVGEENIDE